MAEVGRFRRWADDHYPGVHSGEWECDYLEWPGLYSAVLGHVASVPFDQWSAEDIEAVLYAIARDNEMEHLVTEIRDEHPEMLLPLARSALPTGEPDAKWQLAVHLGRAGSDGEEVQRVLVALAHDPDEYVRRRSLRALARLLSPLVEALATAEWNRPDLAQEYARMNVLWCLHRVSSPLLAARLVEAEADCRPYLTAFAKEVRENRVDQ